MGFGSAPPEEPLHEEGALNRVPAQENPWDRSFAQAFERLVETHVGAQLFERAKSQLGVQAPSDLFIPANQSRTDAVLVRDFDTKTGGESRKRKVKIYLKTGQRLQDLVMDMAHELTHAVSNPSWDPYDPDLSGAKYIRLSIEGEGGEVAALLNECTVGLELFRAETSSLRRCQKYLDPDVSRPRTQLNRALVVKDFYRVGRWHAHLERELKKRPEGRELLALLSSEEAVVYSSTGRAPYPVALLREHAALTRVACENTRQRIRSRSLASSAQTHEQEPSIRSFLTNRCGEGAPRATEVLPVSQSQGQRSALN